MPLRIVRIGSICRGEKKVYKASLMEVVNLHKEVAEQYQQIDKG